MTKETAYTLAETVVNASHVLLDGEGKGGTI